MEHTVEHHAHMDDDLDRQHADVSHRIPDLINIILDSRHQFSGVRIVKIIHRQCLNVPEQILTDLCADLRT